MSLPWPLLTSTTTCKGTVHLCFPCSVSLILWQKSWKEADKALALPEESWRTVVLVRGSKVIHHSSPAVFLKHSLKDRGRFHRYKSHGERKGLWKRFRGFPIYWLYLASTETDAQWSEHFEAHTKGSNLWRYWRSTKIDALEPTEKNP